MRSSALGTDHFTLEEGLCCFFHTKPKKKIKLFPFWTCKIGIKIGIKKIIVEKIQAQIIFVISGQINDHSLIHNNKYVVYLFFGFHEISKSKMKVLCIYMYMYIETETQKIDLI